MNSTQSDWAVGRRPMLRSFHVANARTTKFADTYTNFCRSPWSPDNLWKAAKEIRRVFQLCESAHRLYCALLRHRRPTPMLVSTIYTMPWTLMYKPATGRWLTFLVAEKGLDRAIHHHPQHHDWEEPNAVAHHEHHQQVHGHRLPWT